LGAGFLASFFWRGVLWFLQGVFAKTGFSVWCFSGEFVVRCVVNVVQMCGVFRGRKTGHHFGIYFRRGPNWGRSEIGG
jgi:hypothetical protein